MNGVKLSRPDISEEDGENHAMQVARANIYDGL